MIIPAPQRIGFLIACSYIDIILLYRTSSGKKPRSQLRGRVSFGSSQKQLRDVQLRRRRPHVADAHLPRKVANDRFQIVLERRIAGEVGGRIARVTVDAEVLVLPDRAEEGDVEALRRPLRPARAK